MKNASILAANGFQTMKETAIMEQKCEEINQVHRRGFSCDEAEAQK